MSHPPESEALIRARQDAAELGPLSEEDKFWLLAGEFSTYRESELDTHTFANDGYTILVRATQFFDNTFERNWTESAGKRPPIKRYRAALIIERGGIQGVARVDVTNDDHAGRYSYDLHFMHCHGDADHLTDVLMRIRGTMGVEGGLMKDPEATALTYKMAGNYPQISESLPSEMEALKELVTGADATGKSLPLELFSTKFTKNRVVGAVFTAKSRHS